MRMTENCRNKHNNSSDNPLASRRTHGGKKGERIIYNNVLFIFSNAVDLGDNIYDTGRKIKISYIKFLLQEVVATVEAVGCLVFYLIR